MVRGMNSMAEQAAKYLERIYNDWRSQVETRRAYYQDGRVEAFDGQEWWSVCRLTSDQVQQAQAVMRASGLLSATDLTASDVHDTAALTFLWWLDDEHGQVTNWVYPAHTHPVFERIREVLDELESDAGAFDYLDQDEDVAHD
jgi:hypothetical protein